MHTSPLAPRYILCRFVPMANGKTNKIPLNPSTLQSHNPLDSNIHLPYATAKELVDMLDDSYGLGFVLMPEDGYFLLDLDNCITPDNNWTPTAIQVMQQFPHALFEISNSGRGLHIIGRYQGSRPVHGCKNLALGLELYTGDRFCALTEGNPTGSAETFHTEALSAFIGQYLISSQPEVITQWTTEPAEGHNPPEDIIQFMLNKPLNAQESFGGIITIRDLWENNVAALSKAYPDKYGNRPYDASSADAALASQLIYFTAGNCERTLELMKLSGLAREKWNRPDYLPRTIERAWGIKKDYYKYAHSPQVLVQDNKTIAHNQQNLTIKMLQDQNYPELSTRGKVLDTSTNLKFLLETYGITVRWNIMSREREITILDDSICNEDAENSALRILEDTALLNDMPITRIDKNLNTLAQKNMYHPIIEGLKANPWDGISRLDEFIATLHTSTPELSYKLIRRWMISAIAAAHSIEGNASSGVLVLAGEQNIGKTRWIKSLDPFNCKAIKGGALLDPTNKDCIRTLSCFWIVELGELDASFRKADIARLKSYLTEDTDRVRFPWAPKDSILPRRTVFAASVNDSNFLVDETGNRRWWTIPVISINDKHNVDMVQVWAEVFNIWKSGEQSWLTPDEFQELNIHNTSHEQLNPLEEGLHLFYDFSEGWKFKPKQSMSSTEVLRILGYLNPTKAQCTQMGKILMKVTGVIPQRNSFGRFHKLVPRINMR